MRLKDKAAVVTGAGRGIGEGIAPRFAEEGAKLIVNDVNEADASRTVEAIKSKGSGCVNFQCAARAGNGQNAPWENPSASMPNA